MKKIIFLLLCVWGFLSEIHAQTYNDGQVQVMVRVRDIQVTAAENDVFLFGVVGQPDDYTFNIWGQDNANVDGVGWTGTGCLTEDFTPPGFTTDYNNTFYDQTYPGAVSPQFIDIRLEAWEDESPDQLLGVGCVGTRCAYETNFCCGGVLFGACLGIITSDENYCNTTTFASLDYRLGSPCEWYDHGYVDGDCPAATDFYRPRLETFWRFIQGTDAASAIDLGTYTVAGNTTHSNNTTCYTNDFLNSPGNDIFYTFTLTTPMTVSMLLDNSFAGSVLYLLDQTLTPIDSSFYTAPGDGLSFCSSTLAAGTYYIVVDGVTTADFGTFDLYLGASPAGLTSQFNLNPPLGCSVPHTVFFTDQSTAPDTWFWDFGDFNTSTAQNPIHTYTTTGKFTVSLTVTDTITGCVDVSHDTVTVSLVSGSLSSATVFGCGPLTTTFNQTISSTAGIQSLLWDFGDGDTSSLPAPMHTYDQPGIYTVTLAAVDSFGCSRLITETNYIQVIGPNVNFGTTDTLGCAPYAVNFSDSTIFGAPIISWNWDFGDGNTSNLQNPNHTYTAAGNYDVSLTINDIDGCARTTTFSNYISVGGLVTNELYDTICIGDSYLGVPYTTDTVFRDTVFIGCDTITNLNLEVLEVFSAVIDTTLCEGESLSIFGASFNQAGNFTDTIRYASTGCDSLIYTLNLTFDTAITQNFTNVICSNQLYQVHGFTYNQTGIYQDTVYHVNSGCDSIRFTVDLRVDSVTTLIVDTFTCNGVPFSLNGFTYTTSGFYQDTIRYVGSNCDSLRQQVNLVIDTSIAVNYDTLLCEGTALSVHGFTYNQPGFYQDTIRYQNTQCDSLVLTVNLAIDTASVFQIDTTICAGESVTVFGQSFNTPGTYTDTLFYTNSGCDSIRYVVNLMVDSAVDEQYDTILCAGESLNLYGTNYNSSGTYSDTLFAQSGCDSIRYTLNLTVDSVAIENYDTVICEGDVFSVHGVDYNSTGLFNDTLFHNSGCDSIRYTVNLVVDSATEENYDTVLCEGEIFTVHGINYSATGIYSDTLFYNSGCDSIRFSVNLRIDTALVEQYDTTICEGETVSIHGSTYNAAGTYSDTLLYSDSGCDSIRYTLNLVIDSVVTEQYDSVVCEGTSVTIHGTTYTNAGFYSDTLFHASGCDSIRYTLNLTIDSVMEETYDTTICQGATFTVHGSTYSASGFYADTLTYGSSGCDSIRYTLNLVIDSFIQEQYDTAICDGNSFDVHGNSYNTTGLYNDVVAHQGSSCDSIQYTIDLIVHPVYGFNQIIEICSNDSALLPDGSYVNTSGVYTNSFLTNQGCDSIYVTDVTVNQLGSISPLEDVAVCSGLSEVLTLTAENIVSVEWLVNEGAGFVSLLDSASYQGANTESLIIPLDTSLHQNEYMAIAVDACGNVYSDTLQLTVYVPHEVANPFGDTAFCAHEIEIITVPHAGNTFTWSDGSFGPSILPETSGTYVVSYVEEGTNCIMNDTINVSIEDCIGNCVVLAPSGFSPNTDNNNDQFNVVTSCEEGFSLFYFEVRNRFGELVFATDDYTLGWDGFYKGKPAPIGTYSYFVEYVKNLSNEKQVIKGNVTLIR